MYHVKISCYFSDFLYLKHCVWAISIQMFSTKPEVLILIPCLILALTSAVSPARSWGKNPNTSTLELSDKTSDFRGRGDNLFPDQ